MLIVAVSNCEGYCMPNANCMTHTVNSNLPIYCTCFFIKVQVRVHGALGTHICIDLQEFFYLLTPIYTSTSTVLPFHNLLCKLWALELIYCADSLRHGALSMYIPST